VKAIILCAGYGKRMNPYTETCQKTMIPVHGKPLLEYIVEGLIRAGFNKLILVVGYRKEQIMDHFKDGAHWNANIEYVVQENLNGTGGALLVCESLIKDKHFFLTWGDILVPYRIYKMIHDFFRENKHDFILVSNYNEDVSKGGAIYCEGDYCLDIIEKEPKGTGSTNLNNCGIFILSTEVFKVLKNLPPSERDEIEITTGISVGIKQRGWKVRVLKMNMDDFRGDFGDKAIYERLIIDTGWLKELKE